MLKTDIRQEPYIHKTRFSPSNMNPSTYFERRLGPGVYKSQTPAPVPTFKFSSSPRFDFETKFDLILTKTKTQSRYTHHSPENFPPKPIKESIIKKAKIFIEKLKRNKHEKKILDKFKKYEFRRNLKENIQVKRS